MMRFEKLSITDLIVVICLSLALFISIFKGSSELSMSIASGLLGYIGGTGKHVGGDVK